MADLDCLTKNEMYSLLKHLQRTTKYPVAKEVYERTLRYFDDKCPGCGVENEKSCIVRIFKENSDYDIVTYICAECGTVYRKYEDKREVIEGSLLEVIEKGVK